MTNGVLLTLQVRRLPDRLLLRFPLHDCILPLIQQYYESEKGRRELAEWEKRQKWE